MQNEKNNNWHWKQKLSDADFIPTEAWLNKEVAWQKLQQRLSKPKRRKEVGYWAAAACLIPLIIALLVIFQQKKNAVAIAVVSHKPIAAKPFLKETKLLHEDAIVSKKLSAKKKNTIITKAKSSSILIDAGKEITINKKEDSFTVNKDVVVVIPPDTAVKTNVAIAVKTKLKVVHINELGEPEEAAPVVAHNIYPHSFSMQIGREEVYGTSASTKSKIGFLNLPIKSSSN